MCEEIYGKIVVMLLLLPISITSVFAVWHGMEFLADKWVKGVEKDIAKDKTKSHTREEIELKVKLEDVVLLAESIDKLAKEVYDLHLKIVNGKGNKRS